MQTIGITGGIGSGKSTVARLIHQLGYPVYTADREASRLMNTDKDIRLELTRCFGQEIYTPSGTVNKPLLASLIFQDRQALMQVNRIVHPRVMADFENWSRCQDREPVFFESAILFEAALDHFFDFIICVTAPEAVRLKRVVKRDRTTTEAVRARMKNQMDEQEKCKRSDFTVRNDEQHPVIQQVLEIIQHIPSS